MEKIDINNLDKKFLINTRRDTDFYVLDNDFFKAFNDLDDSESQLLEEKVVTLNKLNIKNVLLPKKIVVSGSNCVGYSTSYIDNSKSLAKKFGSNYINTYEYFIIINEISKTLRKIHEKGVIYQDLHFENIILDKNFNHYFCDIDGVDYLDFPSENVSDNLYRFICEYKNFDLKVDQNTDRLSMLISFMNVLVGKTFYRLTKQELNSLFENLNTLSNLEELIFTLKNKGSDIPFVPYLDDVIDLSDKIILSKKEFVRTRSDFNIYKI